MRRLLPALLAALAAQAAAQNTNDPRVPTTGKSDWELRQEERDWKEGEVGLPAQPRGDALIEFPVSAASRFRFFIDAPSLSVNADGVVRYTLVARSASGHDNVSYEGMRCGSNSYKVYAYANAGAWSRGDADWKAIESRGIQRWHNELRDRYFCPLRLPIASAAEGLDALRRGGHPLLPALDPHR
ncbi:MAG: CNP1-like family protein [Betaproteobacteria bacterium]|nr:CNP1-like family protein [Betaproteobacteria bacterium]